MAENRANLKTVISADSTQFNSALGRAVLRSQRVASSIEQSFGRASLAMGKLALKGAAIGGSLAAAASAAALFKGVKLAASLESTTVAFETLTGSADTAKKVLEELRILGAETPFEFPELADAGRKLIAFGEGADTVAETLRRVGDVSSAIQAPIGEIAELYGKARVQGRLFGEDINQLTGRGIPIIGMLAKQFGVAESEVKKLVEKGEVGFGNLERAFIDLTSSGGMFYGMMAKQSLTFNGQLSNLQDALGNLLTRFAAPINAALIPHLTKATELLNEMAPKMEAVANRFIAGFDSSKIIPVFSAMGEFLAVALVEGFSKGIQIAGALLQAVFSKAGLSFIGDTLVNLFLDAFVAITNAAVTLGENIAKALSGKWDEMESITGGGKNGTATFADELEKALNGIDWSPSDKMTDAAKTFTDTVGKLFPEAVGKGSEADLYDKELAEQRARVAADSTAMTPSAVSPIFEQMGPSKSLMMPRALGRDSVFNKDRERLGVGSGLVTGGLGEKRRLATSKDKPAEPKEELGFLQSIDRNIKSALSVG